MNKPPAPRGAGLKPARLPANNNLLRALERGQVWKAGENYLLIVETGRLLVHYKMAKTLGKSGLRKHMASAAAVRAFLKAQRAELQAKPGAV